MGIFRKAMSGLGLSDDESETDASVNGISSMSSLAYVGDAQKGHFIDLFWSREPLDPIPVIFYFNGGSFGRTDRGSGDQLCRMLAKRGFLVVNAEFRDIGRNISVKDELDDVSAMVKWVLRNTQKFKIDLERVYAVGSSYGALMALWMAMACNGTRFRNALGTDGPGFKIRGLGLFTGMTDTESGDAAMRPVADSIRELSKTDKELAECLLPWSNHDLRILPPVFQVTSDFDPAQPDIARLDELLDTNRVSHETMTFPGTPHTTRGFMEKFPSSAECTRAVSRMLMVFRDQ